MEPGFPAGSWVRVSPLAYLWRSPRRHEVVVLRAPHTPERLELKRVLALPGERVTWKGTEIHVQGKLLEEPYAQKTPITPGDEEQSLLLKKREYFVAGDNRLHSQDSRTYGPVSLSNILGRVIQPKILLAS